MKKLNILYLEDDPLDVELVCATFEADYINFNLEHVKTQSEFVTRLDSQHFDIILADYSLPSFDGISALKIAREKCPEIPFIIISGKIGEEVAIDTVKSGATDYVLKQRLNRLIPAMRRALNEAEEHRKRKEAEAALKESKRLYEDLVEKAGIAICIVDKEGNFKFFNHKFVELFGHSAVELKTLSILQLAHSDDVHLVIDRHQSCHQEDKPPGRYEFRGVRKDGKTIYLEVDSVAVREGDEIVGTRCYLWDITERKLIENELQKYRAHLEELVTERNAELLAANEKLRLSEEKYRNIVELAPDIIVTLDAEGRITSCNTAALTSTALSKKEIIGKYFLDLTTMPPEDVNKFTDLFTYLKDGNVPAPFEFSWHHPDGSTRFGEAHINVLKGEEKKITTIHLFVRDITENKKAEQALRASEERYRVLYEKNPTMYFTIDAEGQVLSVNQFGAEQLGYTVEELVGQSVFKVVYEDDQTAVKDQLITCLQNPNQIRSLEFRKIRKDSSILWVKETARVVTDANGKNVFLIVCEDITDRINAQHEKDKLARQLAETEKLVTLGQFTAAISHEINNPLDVILTELYSLQKLSQQNLKILDYTQKIKQQVYRIDHLAKDILNYVKPHALKFETTEINTIILNAIESLAEYLNGNVNLETDLRPDLPLVQGDTIGLEIVFKNVILNSIEAIPQQGQILVSTRKLENDRLEVIIKDNGVGIPEKELNKIFDRFYTSKRKSGGTGLGLTICKEIIKQHNGVIKVKSKSNKGTTVIVQLPVIGT